jgi:hypothetical protein
MSRSPLFSPPYIILPILRFLDLDPNPLLFYVLFLVVVHPDFEILTKC